MKAGFDIRNQSADDVCKKWDHEKCEHDQEDDVVVSLCSGGSCHWILIMDFDEEWIYFTETQILKHELHQFEKQASTVDKQIFQFVIFSKTFRWKLVLITVIKLN